LEGKQSAWGVLVLGEDIAMSLAAAVTDAGVWVVRAAVEVVRRFVDNVRERARWPARAVAAVVMFGARSVGGAAS
jgi:hypothetical protein